MGIDDVLQEGSTRPAPPNGQFPLEAEHGVVGIADDGSDGGDLLELESNTCGWPTSPACRMCSTPRGALVSAGSTIVVGVGNDADSVHSGLASVPAASARRPGLGFLFGSFSAGSAASLSLRAPANKPGEKAPAQERVDEELDGGRITVGAFGQRHNPARQILGVFRVGEPGGGVGDEVKEARANDAAGEQAQKRGAPAKPRAKPDDEQEGAVVHQLADLKGLHMSANSSRD